MGNAYTIVKCRVIRSDPAGQANVNSINLSTGLVRIIIHCTSSCSNYYSSCLFLVNTYRAVATNFEMVRLVFFCYLKLIGGVFED